MELGGLKSKNPHSYNWDGGKNPRLDKSLVESDFEYIIGYFLNKYFNWYVEDRNEPLAKHTP